MAFIFEQLTVENEIFTFKITLKKERTWIRL